MRIRLTFLIAAIAAARTAGAVCTPSGIVLADPATYTIPRCWNASDLGVPLPLGGLEFSDDGSMLWVIGAADLSSSAVYALPVTRDPVSGEVTALGTPTAPFPGNPPTADSGLDAGPVVGPGGTVFLTYFGGTVEDVTVIAERPGGLGGTETQFNAGFGGLGLQALGGITFSPFRTDPATQFGRLQATIQLGEIQEIALTPAGGGVFTPSSPERFAVVQPTGLGEMEYVGGVGLLYTSLEAGTLQALAIDPATGLAIDSDSMIPTLGTTNPVDSVFASGFAPGPLGLALDGTTREDLFIGTFDDLGGQGAIYQVHGFSPTTTTVTVASTTSTTTLPAGCPDAPSFDEVDCRIGALLTAVDAAPNLGRLRERLRRKLTRARQRVADAESRMAAGRRGGARRALAAATRGLRGFKARLASRAARGIPTEIRSLLSADADRILADLQTLVTML